MAVQVSYPGVYIEEFTPASPIQGVGTSTPAFIGPTASGELDTPTKITSWEQFQAIFGKQPLTGFYLWFAVRGFFENGGKVCYVVRASNGAYEGRGFGIAPFEALQDRADNALLRVRARQPGVNAPPIEVAITEKHLINEPDGVYRPQSDYTLVPNSPREIDLNPEDAAQFKPGDLVDLGSAGHPLQILAINTISNLVTRLRMTTDLTGPADAAGMRLADTDVNTRALRLHLAAVPPGSLVPGALLTFTQGQVTESAVLESVQVEPLATSPAITTHRVSLRSGLTHSFSLAPGADAISVASEEIDFEIQQGSASTLLQNLGVDPAHSRYYLTTVNGSDGLVTVEAIEPPPPVAPPLSLPADTGGFVPLGGGVPETLGDLQDIDYLDALRTLENVDDVNLIAISDRITPGVQIELIAHCQRMGDRFAILDANSPAQGAFGAGSISEQRASVESPRGYAALYYPWLRVPPAAAGGTILVPPSGHVCGIIARSDNTRGVHKAPANEIVSGAVGVAQRLSDIDHGQLNLDGINVIRVFQGAGRPVLFGARTTAKDDRNWQYVNIRRLFLFLEESIQEGIRWAVFEPNNLSLWQKLRRTITEFLTRVWRDGALFGATAKDAFYVRIDEVLNPFSEQALGRLNIEVGVRPSYPAEFIIVRIGIWQGGSEVTEV